jgi:hypothetical protein
MDTQKNRTSAQEVLRGFSVEEFCRRYGIGRTRAYQELNAGRLRARKVGKRTIVTADDAESWLSCLPNLEAQG